MGVVVNNMESMHPYWKALVWFLSWSSSYSRFYTLLQREYGSFYGGQAWQSGLSQLLRNCHEQTVLRHFMRNMKEFEHKIRNV